MHKIMYPIDINERLRIARVKIITIVIIWKPKNAVFFIYLTNLQMKIYDLNFIKQCEGPRKIFFLFVNIDSVIFLFLKFDFARSLIFFSF